MAVAWQLSMVYLPQQESTDRSNGRRAMGCSCAGPSWGALGLHGPLGTGSYPWHLALALSLMSFSCWEGHRLHLGPGWERSLDPLLSCSPICPPARLCQLSAATETVANARVGLVHAVCAARCTARLTSSLQALFYSLISLIDLVVLGQALMDSRLDLDF